MGDVVRLVHPQRGNGAREAMIRILGEAHHEDADWLLAALWMEGFRLVPIDDGGPDAA